MPPFFHNGERGVLAYDENYREYKKRYLRLGVKVKYKG